MFVADERKQQIGNKNIGVLSETFQTVVIEGFDIVVAGGGIAGATAAIAAARNGARVAIIEKTGCFGGLATGGLVNYATPFKDWNEQIVGGIAEELMLDLLKQNGIESEYDVSEEHPWLAKERKWEDLLFGDTKGKKRYGVQFDAEYLKVLLDDLITQAKVKIFFHSFVVSAVCSGGSVKNVIIESKMGRFSLAAKYFIDCTGDADLAATAGAEFQKGRPSDGKMLPVSLMLRFRGVDVEKAMAYQKEELAKYGYADLIVKARENGELDIPHQYILVRPTIYNDGLEVNGTRITDIDGTDVYDLTRAELVLRRQSRMLLQMFRKYVPGCENAYIAEMAPMVGVRETRRVVGLYIMQDDDLPNGTKFEDSVGRGTVHVDIHRPEGGGYDIKPVKAGDWYEIPYRSLVVKGFKNLFIAGRCISATSVAQSGLRLYLNVLVGAQGAGTAAALCLKNAMDAGSLDVKTLQDTLRAQGVKLR